MRLQLFKYDVPKELIAQYPIENKEQAKLMVLHRGTGKIEHRSFSDLIEYFNSGDVIVANDSYMMNNLLYGIKDSIKIKVCLLKNIDTKKNTWDVFVSPSRKVRIGNKIYFPTLDTWGSIHDNTAIRGRLLKFETDKPFEEFLEMLQENASVNLPEYIKRDPQKEDKEYVKSIYSKNFGSLDNVISGLHFTERFLLKLKLKEIEFGTLTYTLTNFPLNKFATKTISTGKRVPEFCEINEDLVDKINFAKDKNKRICGVGYSSTMGIENAYSIALDKLLKTKTIVTKTIINKTDFNVCNAILTNFHENGSTFLIVDTAFCGFDLMRKVYEEAIKNKYRFHMYGDSLLII